MELLDAVTLEIVGEKEFTYILKTNKDQYISGYNVFIAHKKQCELVKEITINEEEFDKAFDKILNAPYFYDLDNSVRDSLKEELFKGVK